KVQHLIGPDVFPFWWAALKVTLSIVFVVYLVFAILAATSGFEVSRVADKASPSLFGALVFAFGAVTLVCALIERYGKVAVLGRWTPRQLPPVAGRTRKRLDILVEAILGVVAIAWWTHLIHFPNSMGYTGITVDLAPLWQTFWWPILGYLLFELVGNVAALVQPGLLLLNAALRML